MIENIYSDEVEREIKQALASMFPYGAGRTTHTRVEHHLHTVAKRAFQAGKIYALMGLMTANDIAEHFNISPRRARALIKNRHERFGVGMQFGKSWLVHRDELNDLTPEEKYHTKNS